MLAEHEDAKPLAGGQSLVPMLNFRLARPAALVDLAEIDALAGVRVEDGTLVVGAMTRQWDLEHSSDAFPLLREALAHVGHTATRCRGTVGGSLAHADPTAELPVCALALGAELVTSRRMIPAEEFFLSVFTTALEPDELLVEVRFPAPAGPTAFLEHAHRHGDFAVVCVARAGDRVAVGGVGPTPMLWDGGALDPVGDLFAPAGYKRRRRAGTDRADGGTRDRDRPHRERHAARASRRAAAPALRLPPPRAVALRHSRRLRARRLRCVHGAARRPAGAVVPDPGRCRRTVGEIRTVESLADGATLHPLQQAFHEHFGLQCGFCTPGILMTARVPARAESRSDRGGDPRRAGRQPLPLHRLRADRRLDPGGGRDATRVTSR